MEAALFTSALTLLLTALAPPAWACSCADDSPLPFPADGAAAVPLNPTLWFLYEDAAERSLTLWETATEAPVSATTTWVESRGRQAYAVLSPDAPLTAETAYSLGNGDRTTGFTTGTERDETAPVALTVTALNTVASPEFLEVECGILQSSSCGTSAFVWLELAEPDDAVIYEILVVPDSDDDLLMTAFSLSAPVYGGHGACLSNMSRMEHETGGTVQVRALDLAANTGPWTEPTHFTLDWPQDAVCDGDTGLGDETAGCGCESAVPRTSGWLWLWLPALVGLRRQPSARSRSLRASV